MGRAEAETLSDDDLVAVFDRLAGGSKPGHALLVVDGAERLSLEAIRYIQFACRSAPPLQVVFAGAPDFRERLAREEFARLRGRLRPDLVVPRLSDEDAVRYVQNRFRLARLLPEQAVEPGVPEAIARGGQGLPGRINALQERALAASIARGEQRVTVASVQRALESLGGLPGGLPARAAPCAPLPAAAVPTLVHAAPPGEVAPVAAPPPHPIARGRRRSGRGMAVAALLATAAAVGALAVLPATRPLMLRAAASLPGTLRPNTRTAQAAPLATEADAAPSTAPPSSVPAAASGAALATPPGPAPAAIPPALQDSAPDEAAARAQSVGAAGPSGDAMPEGAAPARPDVLVPAAEVVPTAPQAAPAEAAAPAPDPTPTPSADRPAELATEHAPAPADTATEPAAASAPTPGQDGAVQEADPTPAPPPAAESLPVAPTPGASTPVAASVPAPPVPAAPEPAVSPTLAAVLLARGNAALAVGDISGARLLLGRAADGGGAPALVAAGRAYDPAVLARLGAVGIGADRTRAAAYYRRAAALGDTGAADRRRALESGGK
jgi:hypothetical protein